jgi:hypothetical protein
MKKAAVWSQTSNGRFFYCPRLKPRGNEKTFANNFLGDKT